MFGQLGYFSYFCPKIYKKTKGMKKSLFLLLGLLTSMVMLADDFAKQGEKTIDGITYEYGIVTRDDYSTTYEATITDGKNFSGTKLEILSSIPIETNEEGNVNYSVTSIGKEAFKGNTNLDYVIIPNGINTIELSAFQNCSSITKLELPATIASIGNYAFAGCSNLTYVFNKSTNENSINPEVFNSNNLMTLFVVADCLNAYKKFGFFNNFI